MSCRSVRLYHNGMRARPICSGLDKPGSDRGEPEHAWDKAMYDTQQMLAGAQEAQVLRVLEKLNQSHAME